MPKSDITYISDGIYITLFANTKDGEYIWNTIAAKFDGAAKFPQHMFASIKSQIKTAGYSIRKERKSNVYIDKLLADLEA